MSRKPSTVAVLDIGDCHKPQMEHLAGRFAHRQLGGHSLANRIARRLSEATRIDKVLVTGSNLPSRLVAGIGYPVLDLPFEHVCERLAAAADSANADWVVYVPGNRPFIDPSLVDCLVSKALTASNDYDYVGFSGKDGNWERIRQLGVAGEVCHADALRRLRRNVDRLHFASDELSLAGWLTSAPGNYQLKFVSIPAELDRNDLRFSIEDESDWELIELLSDHIGEDLEWQKLTNLIHDNHSVREIMAQKNSLTHV